MKYNSGKYDLSEPSSESEISNRSSSEPNYDTDDETEVSNENYSEHDTESESESEDEPESSDDFEDAVEESSEVVEESESESDPTSESDVPFEMFGYHDSEESESESDDDDDLPLHMELDLNEINNNEIGYSSGISEKSGSDSSIYSDDEEHNDDIGDPSDIEFSEGQSGGAPVHTCEYENCNYTTTRKGDFKRHVSQFHEKPEKKYKCDYPGCTYSGYANYKLEKHKEIHTRTKNYACPECDYTARYKSHIDIHKKRKHFNQQCIYCNEHFDNESDYLHHKNTHQKDRDAIDALLSLNSN